PPSGDRHCGFSLSSSFLLDLVVLGTWWVVVIPVFWSVAADLGFCSHHRISYGGGGGGRWLRWWLWVLGVRGVHCSNSDGDMVVVTWCSVLMWWCLDLVLVCG
ncbi:hypothetical protein A2U01_0052131, partial [Trifolium medium]|nr:hypothetical protein [Trifolium medium]